MSYRARLGLSLISNLGGCGKSVLDGLYRDRFILVLCCKGTSLPSLSSSTIVSLPDPSWMFSFARERASSIILARVACSE